MSATGYRKLSRKSHTLGGYSQLWMAGDHLLIVNSSNYVERYQRFAFSDIQSIVAAKGGIYWAAVIWTLIGVGMLLIAWAAGPVRTFFLGVAGLGFAIAAIDLLRGPRCRCTIQTAVSRERLRALPRLRAAQKLIASITPIIEAAQGGLFLQTAAPGAQGVVPPLQEAAPVEPARPLPMEQTGASGILQPGGPPQLPTVRHARSYLPETLFGLLALDSVLVWFALRPHGAMATELVTALYTIYVAELLIGIIAISKSSASLPSAVVIVAFLCIVSDLIFLTGPAAWHSFVSNIQQQAQRAANPADALGPLVTYPALRSVALASGWRLAVGVIGLGICFWDRRERQPWLPD